MIKFGPMSQRRFDKLLVDTGMTRDQLLSEALAYYAFVYYETQNGSTIRIRRPVGPSIELAPESEQVNIESESVSLENTGEVKCLEPKILAESIHRRWKNPNR